jgi:PAS domain S-box-containing protein
MKKAKPTKPKPAVKARVRLDRLRKRLRTAEETLRAIRAGEVDALVTGARTKRVVTLAGAELPYSIIFEQMYEGTITLTRQGIVAHCNRRFAEMVRAPLARIVGSPVHRFVPIGQQAALSALHKGAGKGSTRGEFSLLAADGSSVPVSVSFAPLQLEGATRAIGVIAVVADISERRRAEELQARLTGEVMTAQDEERRRIARELHDETGQSLTGLLVGLRTIEASRSVAEATELAEQLRGIAAEGLGNLRRLMSGLHPSVLDDLGLSAAVRRHVQQFAELHGLTINLRIAGTEPDGLPPLVQNTVYRVLQEALTNVAKHSRAQSARVRLASGKAAIELEVRDDGIGISRGAAKKAPSSGLGLRGMRERAALLGGAIRIDSGPGQGTTITCFIPLQSPVVASARSVPVRQRRR